MFSEVAEIALVATRLGQFQQLLKTRVILILNFTRPHAITYTNSEPSNLGKATKANVSLFRLFHDVNMNSESKTFDSEFFRVSFVEIP